MELTVEAVARALAVADGANPDADWRASGDVFLTVAVEHPQTWRLYTRAAAAALQQMPGAARPTADLGEDGEEELRAAFDGDSVPAKNIALRQAYDRLILYREALVAARPYVEANASRDSRMTAHHKGADVLDKIDAVLSRSGL